MTTRADLLRRLAAVADDLGLVEAPLESRKQLRAMCRAARLSLESASVSVARLEGDTLVYEAADGAGDEQIMGTRLSITMGIAGYVARTGQALIIDQVAGDPRFAREVAERVGYVPDSLLATPITDERGAVLGVLSVLDRRRQGSDTLAIASAFADQAALLLPHIDSVVRLAPVLLSALADAVERGDSDLAGALRRQAGRLPHDTVELAATLAELHSLTPAARQSAVQLLHEFTKFAVIDTAAPMTDIVPAWAEHFVGVGPGPAPGPSFPASLTPAWAYGDGTGRGVRVAVIDSGIEDGHPRVGPVSEAIAIDDSGDEVRFVEGPHDDLYGHGTACAGIIRGLAPLVELVSVRVLGPDLSGSAFAFAHGLDWCIEHGVDIVNLSLSTANEEYAETFYDLTDRAAHRGVMVVSAMNNESKRSIPSEFAAVFSVACCEGRDPERFLSNPHSPAEWGAIGINVDVAWCGGSTIVGTGNSFAAAVITGHLARIVGAHPGITSWQAKTVLNALAANSPRVS